MLSQRLNDNTTDSFVHANNILQQNRMLSRSIFRPRVITLVERQVGGEVVRHGTRNGVATIIQRVSTTSTPAHMFDIIEGETKRINNLGEDKTMAEATKTTIAHQVPTQQRNTSLQQIGP